MKLNVFGQYARCGPRRRLSIGLLLFILSGELLCVVAAAPTLDHFFPVALPAGSTNSVTAIGKFDPWPPQIWADNTGLVFKPETNSGKFTIEVRTNVTAGPHLVRAFDAKGASPPRFLVVTGQPQLSEQEPNDDFAKAQLVEHLPASINGRLDKSGDVDCYAVTLRAGQTVTASVEAYILGSPVDAVLRLIDTRGEPMAWNHDDRTLDPFLTWTAPSAGRFILQVFGFAYPATSDVKFTGGNACVYRLHLSRSAYLHYTLPLGVQRGASTKLRLFGWNLDSGTPHEAEFNGATLSPSARLARFDHPDFSNSLDLPVGDGPEVLEKEPNDSAAGAMHVEIPSAVTGCIDKVGDEDRFSFQAKKGERLAFEILSASLGFPLDARLKIEDATGKELAKSDDSVNADSALEWTVPNDGTFVAAVGNVLHRGGPDHLYRLSVARPLPAWRATVAEHAFTLEAGKTNEIKVAIKRLHGFEAKLSLEAKNLPEGVTAERVDIGEKKSEISIKLIAVDGAKSFSGPIQLVVKDSAAGLEQTAVHELIASGVNNGVPNGFSKLVIEATDQLWLTILPPAPAKTESGK